MYRLCFYVPESHLESVKSAVFAAGAGRYRHYDRCCWQVKGEGQFQALAGSKPFLGKEGALTCIAEFKVEMVCADDCIPEVIAALLASHPYEEPAYGLQPIFTLEDFSP